MSDNKYNFDEYRRDDVLVDTYATVCDVEQYLYRCYHDTNVIRHECNPEDARIEEANLNVHVTDNIVNAVKDRLYDVDTDNKVIRGVDVEAVRCIIGEDEFGNFFRPSKILRDSIDPEVAVQLMSPMDSVRWCHMHGDLEYPVEFSELMFKSTVNTLCGLSNNYISDRVAHRTEHGFSNLARDLDAARVYSEAVAPRLVGHFEDLAEYLKDRTVNVNLTDETRKVIDKVYDNFAWPKVDVPEKKCLDLTQFYGENKYSDGTDIELGD